MRIGLTGGIGSGKSFVAAALQDLGAYLIDADLLAREVVAPGSAGLAEIVAQFGTGVLAPDGSLNRTALADIVFSDAEAREQLNGIIHPRVRSRARTLEHDAGPASLVIHVIPLLIETGQQELFDEVIVVDVPLEVQLSRVMAREGYSEAIARQRIDAQCSRQDRIAAATRIIDNGGRPERTLRAANLLWSDLRYP